MSGSAPKSALRTVLVSLVLTAALVAVAYYVWIYANIGARDFARGTLLTDLRFFFGMLAVFLVLSILHLVLSFIISKISGK